MIAADYDSTERVFELTVPAELGYEDVACEVSTAIAASYDYTPEKLQVIKMAVNEACTNAIRYGCGADPRLKVLITFIATPQRLEILVKDPGVGGVGPGTITPPNIEAMILGQQRMGGIGLYLIQILMDEAGFISQDIEDGNCFRMVIYRSEMVLGQ